MTPLLCVVWCWPSSRARARARTTRIPRSASARAVASPTIPPPATATSCTTPSRSSAAPITDSASIWWCSYSSPMSPDWPKRCTPRHVIGTPWTAARKLSVCGWPSSSETIGSGSGNSSSRIDGSPSAEPGARLEGAEQQVGAGDADDRRAELLGRLHRLRHERAHHRDRHAASRRAAGSRRPARARGPASPASAWSIGRVESRKYADAAVRAAEPRQRVQERPLEVAPERRLPGDAAGLLDPDRRRDDGLVRAALGPERDAARRADEDRLPAGVDAERPRLERARHERVVDRADRQQRLAVARPRRAQLAEQPDEVDLGDPQLDVLAVVALAPAHERVGVVGEPVDAVADRPDAGLVDPAAEVGRGADVRRDGDHARGDVGRLALEVDPEAPERLLGRLAAAVLAAERRRHGRRLDGRHRLAAQPRRRRPRTARPRASRPRSRPTGRRDRCRARRPARRTARRTAAPSGWRDGPRSAAASP